jgi:hypothetical protein
MPHTLDQVLITGELIATPHKTEAGFEKDAINLTASHSKPILLVFSANYRWEEQRDDKVNDWEFFMNIVNEKGEALHSEYKHFGDDDEGFTGDDEEAYKAYLKEEALLRYDRGDDPLKKGNGTLVRSIKTPSAKGSYTYLCQLIAVFWARLLGEDKSLVKNKTESIAECLIRVNVE